MSNLHQSLDKHEWDFPKCFFYPLLILGMLGTKEFVAGEGEGGGGWKWKRSDAEN